ncbi:LysR substrate-binding domain-containing protein [Acidocella sp.]|uniref:LysR substrate-binding domain-containing protein n=1 Tax=Acidocella sp. TaxID=50710 RepID=UPI0026303549|nr:LysR substrate-binding domain-containing protein [Acidocella sp.]
MKLVPTLDPDVLRNFLFVSEELSFTRAGIRAGRTQAAISQQMQKLEAQLGQSLFSRGRGGRVELTAHGLYLLARAREILALNDHVWSVFRAPMVSGVVRLGTPDDYALHFLPMALRRFAETHPAAEVEMVCLPSSELRTRLQDGQLDLCLLSEGHEPPHWPAVPLVQGPLVWVTSARFAPHALDPLPLALADYDCAWRRATIRLLEKAGRRYRIAYISSSATGTMVPVLAGLAVTCAIAAPLPEGARLLPPTELALPSLPDFSVLMLKGDAAPQPLTDSLAAFIQDEVRREAPRLGWRA